MALQHSVEAATSPERTSETPLASTPPKLNNAPPSGQRGANKSIRGTATAEPYPLIQAESSPKSAREQLDSLSAVAHAAASAAGGHLPRNPEAIKEVDSDLHTHQQQDTGQTRRQARPQDGAASKAPRPLKKGLTRLHQAPNADASAEGASAGRGEAQGSWWGGQSSLRHCSVPISDF